MKKNEVIAILCNLAMDASEDINDFYESSMGIMLYEAVERKIEFDGYFRTKWEIEAENSVPFNDEYFDDKERVKLYVFLSALKNKDIFDFLHYVWSLVHNEELSENIIHREIYNLKEKGVKF